MFMSDVSIVVRRMRTQADRAMKEVGVGFPEQVVIMILHAHGAVNQEAIASYLDIDKGAIAKTIAKLEEKGLVKREVNPDNKREKIVELTPAAHETVKKMSSVRAEMESQLFKGFTEAEMRQVCTLMERIARNVQREREGE